MKNIKDKYYEPIIGPFCKKNCIFCCEGGFGKRNFVSLDNFIHTLESNFIDKVYLSGGEPLLNPHLLQYIAYCKSKKIYVGVITAWDSTKNKEFIIDLYNAGLSEITFSLEGPQKIHNLLVADDGAYQNILNVLYFIGEKNINLKVTIASNINAINYKYLPKFLDKILQYFPFISLIKLQFLRIEGMSVKNFELLLLPYEKLIFPFLNYSFSRVFLKKMVFVETPFCVLGKEFKGDFGKNTDFLRNFGSEDIEKFDENQTSLLEIDRSYGRFFSKKCSICSMKSQCPGFDPYYIKKFGEKIVSPM